MGLPLVAGLFHACHMAQAVQTGLLGTLVTQMNCSVTDLTDCRHGLLFSPTLTASLSGTQEWCHMCHNCPARACGTLYQAQAQAQAICVRYTNDPCDT